MIEAHYIRPGDEVIVMFDQGRCPEGKLYGVVRYCPQATGDSFHIESTGHQDRGQLYYVQTFQFMTVTKRAQQEPA